jgi:hypothetical protein
MSYLTSVRSEVSFEILKSGIGLVAKFKLEFQEEKSPNINFC